MKYIITLLFLVLASPCVLAEWTPPHSAPKVSLSQASAVARSYLSKKGAAEDSYADRAILLTVGKKDERIWIIWYASPTKGYTILQVNMNKQVTKASQKQIDRARGIHKK